MKNTFPNINSPMNKTYRNYEVKFANHPALLIHASSDVRAIEYLMRVKYFKLSDFEYIIDSPRNNP